MTNEIVTTPQCVLSLDLAGKTGWAMWINGVVTSGTIDLIKSNNRRFEGHGMRFVRFVRVLKDMPRADLIGFEEVRRHLGTDAAHAYGGYLSHLTAFCDSQTPQIPYEGIPVATIKKRATGSGNASKPEMIEACEKILGRTVTDDNEADALWLLVIMCESSGLPWPGGPVPEPPQKVRVKKSKKQSEPNNR